MVGRRAEKDHSRRVGKNWVMMGFCKSQQRCTDRRDRNVFAFSEQELNSFTSSSVKITTGRGSKAQKSTF